MHPVFLSVFFSTAIAGATTALIKADIHDPNYSRWVALYLLFLLYRSKIMIDDLGWYSELRKAKERPHPADVLFAIVSWVGWFGMAAVVGQNLEYFLVFFILTFLMSSIWIYTADYIATSVNDLGSGRLNKLLRLRSRRHVRWLVANIFLVLAGFLGVFALDSSMDYFGLDQHISSDSLFWSAVALASFVFIVDVCCNIDLLRKSLVEAGDA